MTVSVPEHAPSTDQPCGLRDVQHHVEDAVRTHRGTQPSTHVDEHRVHEAGVVEGQATRGVLPAQVELEVVDGLAIAEPLESLQDHHRGDDARRDRPAAHVLEQVRERLVGEEAVTLTMQQLVNGRVRKLFIADVRARVEHVLMGGRLAE